MEHYGAIWDVAAGTFIAVSLFSDGVHHRQRASLINYPHRRGLRHYGHTIAKRSASPSASERPVADCFKCSARLSIALGVHRRRHTYPQPWPCICRRRIRLLGGHGQACCSARKASTLQPISRFDRTRTRGERLGLRMQAATMTASSRRLEPAAQHLQGCRAIAFGGAGHRAVVAFLDPAFLRAGIFVG
jgi:hypothetical protein